MNVFRVSLRNGAIGRMTRLAVALTVLLWGMSVVFGIEIGTPISPSQPSAPSQPSSPGQPQGVMPPMYTSVETGTYVGIDTSVQAAAYVGIGMGTYAQSDCPPPGAGPTTFADGSSQSYPTCDPLAGFYGQHVLVHLDNDSVLSGILIQACQGFITLEQFHIRRTYAVNIAKILYLEMTDVQ